MIGMIMGLVIVGLVGFWDDVSRLSASLKFGGQIIAGIVAYIFGLRINGVAIPFCGTIDLAWFGLPMTVIWIVAIVNAVNLIDGLDGLAGGVLFFASLVNFTAAIVSGSIVSAALMASIGGAVFGFLLYNWHPARIYLGDGGAYCLGFLLAVSGLLAPVQKASTGVALLTPVLALGLPIVDTSITMLRRFLKRRQIFCPDRGHLHHILLDAGISHRRVVVGLYAICCVLCSVALVGVLQKDKDIAYCLFGASVIGCVYWGGSVKRQLRQAMAKVVSNYVEAGSLESED
jgi:UDP-GlcNAc:undecaprenyl-phosphate GlcNAc-1-phosphate transferase